MIIKTRPPSTLLTALTALFVFDIVVLFGKFTPIIGSVYALLFITFVPGFLTLTAFKLRGLKLGEKVVIATGISLAFLLFGGLLLNVLYMGFRWPDPLSRITLLALINTYVATTLLVAYRRHAFRQVTYTLKRVSPLGVFIGLVPIGFVVQAWAGANILNNMGSNTVSMLLLGEIGAFLFSLAIFNKRFHSWQIAWSIFWITYTLVLMSMLRSHYVIGTDISQEYKAASSVLSQGFWQPTDNKNIYNPCLSVTILPAELAQLMHVSLNTLFKVVMPLLAGAVSLTSYLIFKKFNKTAATLGSIFLISFPGYFITLPQHVRQAAAFFFFALCIMTFFLNLSKSSKKLLFILFAFSMVISHYSTAYFAIALFAIAYLLEQILRLHKSNAHDMRVKQRSSPITTPVLLLLFLFSFFWYSQVTLSSSTLKDFITNSITNISDIFSDRQKASRSSIIDQFNFAYQANPQADLNDVATSMIDLNDEPNTHSSYNLEYLPSESVPSKISGLAQKIIFYFSVVIKKVLLLFIPLGIIYIYVKRPDNIHPEHYIALAVASVIAVLGVMVVPFASLIYSFERAYTQANIILAPLAAIGVLYALKLMKLKHIRKPVAATVFLLYFCFYTGLSSTIIGDSAPYVSLYNSGGEYDSQYPFSSEVMASRWLSSVWQPDSDVVADVEDSNKLLAHADNIHYMQSKFVIPSQVTNSNYVFSGRTNTLLSRGFVFAKGGSISYNYPSSYLAANKNTVYNNGETKIYK